MKSINRRWLPVYILLLSFLFISWGKPSRASESGLPTPTPTLPSGVSAQYTPPPELSSVVEELIQSEDDCPLPCWWGLRPGETTTSEVLDFVRTTFRQEPYSGIQDDGKVWYQAFLPLEAGFLEVIFRTDNNILVITELGLNHSAGWLDANPFLLPQLLENLGTPSDVYMRINASASISYSLAVIYNDIGVMAKYGFIPNHITIDDPIPVCAQDHAEDYIKIWLQSPEDNELVIDNLQPSPGDRSFYGPYLSIEDMAGIDVETFTETFIDNPDGCIEAFSWRELRQQGYH